MKSNTWLRFGLPCLAALSVILASVPAGAAEEPEYTFATVDYPGAAATQIWGMNQSREVVGFYMNVFGGPAHGFVLSQGSYTSVDYPGSTATTLVGIGPSGEIVGDYLLPGGPSWGAWLSFDLTKDGEFIDANYPGHQSTVPIRILSDGTIIGFATDGTPTSKHGITIGPKGNTECSLVNSQHNAATPDGDVIVGYYVSQDSNGLWTQTHGYIQEEGVAVTFDVPNSTKTMPYGINPAGNVVAGTFVDQSAKTHGFVAEKRGRSSEVWSFAQIDFPGATATYVWASNPGGDLAGRYVSSDGKWHGFMACRIED